MSYAQYSEQPAKESVSDLRSSVVMFSIEDVKEDKLFWLERTANLDYFLRMKDEDNEETIRKVDSRDAKKLDLDFASRFLRSQYEIEAAAGECQITLRLMLKGDAQEICRKDDKKNQEFVPFLQLLSKRF